MFCGAIGSAKTWPSNFSPTSGRATRPATLKSLESDAVAGGRRDGRRRGDLEAEGGQDAGADPVGTVAPGQFQA